MSMSGSEVAVEVAWSIEALFDKVLPVLPQRAAVSLLRVLLLACEDSEREPLATIAISARVALTRSAAKHRGRL